jgi:hypothetical protein
MTLPQRPSSPGFYKGMAIVFFLLGGIFIWVAMREHGWFYLAFAAITILNGLMSTLKFLAARES